MNAVVGKVLIVDDESVVRLNLAAFLEDEGFEVTVIANGEDALKMLAETPIDVAVIDLRLPGIDGNGVILRAVEIQPRVKFLIHTGSVNYQLPAALRRLGIEDEHVFQKPIEDMAVIVEAVRHLMGERET
ncbi:MAG: response regulator [Phycisphaerae bacterium]|nr:response regulator [Phycisphaerae bacterium]